MRAIPAAIKVCLSLSVVALAAVVVSAAPDEDAPSRPHKKSGAPAATPSTRKKAPEPDDEKPTPTAGPKATPSSRRKTPKTGDEDARPSPPAAPSKKTTHDDVEEKPASRAAPQLEPPTKTPGEGDPQAATPAPAGPQVPTASLDSSALAEFSSQPPAVQRLLEDALALTKRNLSYKFGSDDPANGGMDCSGTISYLLHQHGFKDVPRDASGQYIWARKHGEFFAVVSKKAGGFEFSDILPGDLMFWSGTYNAADRDPPVTHTMIYLGVERRRKQQVMFGSSDGRTYDGKQRFGVSVFDFRMPRVETASATGHQPDFLGYARIPGLREKASGAAAETRPEPTSAEAETTAPVKKKAVETEAAKSSAKVQPDADPEEPAPKKKKTAATPSPKKSTKRSGAG